MPHCKNENDLKSTLKLFGVETEFKLSRTTDEVQGISFSHGKISFKGSEIDRKCSFANLKKKFEKNRILSENVAQTAKNQAKESPHPTPAKRKHVINGVELSDEQTQILLDGGHIFLENMTKKDGIGKLSAFVFLCDQKKKIFYNYDDPEKFVKYGT